MPHKWSGFCSVASTSLSLLCAGALLLGLTGATIFAPPDAHAQMQTLNAGFGPQRYRDGGKYGIGVYFAPYRFSLYARPEEGAPVLATFRWSRQGGTGNISMTTPAGGMSGVYADRTFLCFYPALDVAMLAVIGENGQGWAEVVYDQKQGKTGWVRLKTPADTRETNTESATGSTTAGNLSEEPAHFGAYQTWLEFMRLNAKVSGVYWLSGVSGYHRALRSRDADSAKLLPVTMIRSLKVRFVRGNWLLVEALDFERNTPIGWIRWRDDDGNLMAFPNLAGLRTPILITGE